MLDLKGYDGFCLLRGDKSKEAMRLIPYCIRKDIPIKKLNNWKKDKCPENYVPSGSVEWCLSILNVKITPDYYPEWLRPYFKRNIWIEDNWPLKKVFIKPRDKYKRFTGFCTHGTYSKKKKPPFICSDIINNIENEWRYYISNGVILCGEWYWGDEINTPDAPQLDIDIPEDYCGAVDFGYSHDIGIFLLEAQHPFSCGWYGDQENDHLYLQWLIDGWIYMKKLIETGSRDIEVI